MSETKTPTVVTYEAHTGLGSDAAEQALIDAYQKKKAELGSSTAEAVQSPLDEGQVAVDGLESVLEQKDV